MRRKYAWERWFGRERTTLWRGRDYYCSQSSMVQMVRNRATTDGKQVRVIDVGDGVIIEVVGDIEDAVQHPDTAPVPG